MPVAALTLLIVTLIYYCITTTADLFPFNNTRDATTAEKRAEMLVNVPILAAPIALLLLAWTLPLPVLAYIGGAVILITALGGLLLWWMPYLAGVTMPWATAGTDTTWNELHARTYAHTITVLPRIGEHPRPNLEHMILHTLFILSGVLTIVAGTTF